MDIPSCEPIEHLARPDAEHSALTKGHTSRTASQTPYTSKGVGPRCEGQERTAQPTMPTPGPVEQGNSVWRAGSFAPEFHLRGRTR